MRRNTFKHFAPSFFFRASAVSAAALALALGSGTAFAQPQDADSAALQKGGGKDGSATYVFDDDNVDGEILRPDGANVGSRNRSRHASLITIRNNFIGELIRLANDI